MSVTQSDLDRFAEDQSTDDEIKRLNATIEALKTRLAAVDERGRLWASEAYATRSDDVVGAVVVQLRGDDGSRTYVRMPAVTALNLIRELANVLGAIAEDT